MIITRASGPIFFLIMGMIMLISVFGYVFLKHPNKDENPKAINEEEEE